MACRSSDCVRGASFKHAIGAGSGAKELAIGRMCFGSEHWLWLTFGAAIGLPRVAQWLIQPLGGITADVP